MSARFASIGLFLLSCAAPVEPVQSALHSGAVAQVGSRQLSPAALQALQHARPDQSPRALLEQWAAQARWAEASLAAGLPNHAQTLAAVRRLYAGWRAEALAKEWTADELLRVRALEWTRYDRPRAVRTHHAVVMAARGAAPEPAVLERLAASVREAVQGTTEFATFEAAAKAIELPTGVELRVEVLPAMTAEGRAVEGDGGFDPTFAAAAAALAEVGAISAPVRTPFGVHVIQVEEVLPAERPSDEELRTLLRDQRIAWRTRLWQSDALERQRGGLVVRIEAAAPERLESVVRRLLDERSAP